MGRGILIGSTGKLIFRNKIQQSSINIIRFCTSGGRSNQSANKIIVVGILEITQLGVSWVIVTTQQDCTQKQIWQENGERKRGRIKQQIFVSGGDENERQMGNNVNFKEMRFVIRNLIDVDDVSQATAPKIPFDVA